MDYLRNLMLETELDTMVGQLDVIGESLLQLNEAVTDLAVTDLPTMYDEAIKRLEAARRGLGLANKLKDPLQKKENARRIMGNMNAIRGQISRLTKATEEMIRNSITDNMQNQQMQARNNVV